MSVVVVDLRVLGETRMVDPQVRAGPIGAPPCRGSGVVATDTLGAGSVCVAVPYWALVVVMDERAALLLMLLLVLLLLMIM